MLLDVGERIVLLSMLPAESDLTTIRIVHELRQELSFTEEEMKTIGLKNHEGQHSWDESVDKDVAVGPRAYVLIQDALKELDANKILTENHLSLWDKFSETNSVVEINDARAG